VRPEPLYFLAEIYKLDKAKYNETTIHSICFVAAVSRKTLTLPGRFGFASLVIIIIVGITIISPKSQFSPDDDGAVLVSVKLRPHKP